MLTFSRSWEVTEQPECPYQDCHRNAAVINASPVLRRVDTNHVACLLACRRFQGFGFVEFHDMRDAEDAQVELDNKTFGGRTLEVCDAAQADSLSCSWPDGLGKHR